MKLDQIRKVDHLLLLVGRNPLPNAIAGQLLLSSGGLITLIYSEETAFVADKLRVWFISKGIAEAKVLKCQVKETDAGDIFQKLIGKDSGDSNDSNIVLSRHSDNRVVGLNYTGATKAMAVHAYRAAETWARKQKKTLVYSYLDANSMRIFFDPNNPQVILSEQ
jgi:hypothetical protein